MLDRVIYDNVTIFNLIRILAVFVSSLIFCRILSFYIRRTLKEKVKKDTREIVIKIITYGIVAIAVLYALMELGINLSGFMVAGGVAGVILGFAGQGIIGNLIAGIFLIIERPIKIGDQVNIDSFAGYVEDIRIVSTTIRTYDGLYVRIPNQNIFTSSIINYVNHIVRRFEYIVGIRYSDNGDKAIQLIKDVIEMHPFALDNPRPQVFVDNLGDNAVNIVVRVWSPISEWYTVKMELLLEIKKALEGEGIEIAFPQRVVWFGSDETTFNESMHEPQNSTLESDKI